MVGFSRLRFARIWVVIVGIAGSVLSVMPCDAEVLIVFTNGTGVQAASFRRDDKSLFYVENTPGAKEQRVAATQVDTIIPEIDRSRDYTPQEVDQVISSIKGLRLKYAGLLSRAIHLQSEWQMMKLPPPILDKEIDGLVKGYFSSDRSLQAYRNVTLQLGMLSYKDVRWKYKETINKHLKNIRDDYIVVRRKQMAAVLQRCGPAVDLDSYQFIRRNHNEAVEAAGEDKALVIDIVAMGEDARKRAMSWNIAQSKDLFAATPVMDRYLESARLLYMVEKSVAKKPEEVTLVRSTLARLKESAMTAMPEYTFDPKGYPFRQEDQEALQLTAPYASEGSLGETELHEQCYLFPLSVPEVRVAGASTVPLRCVFARAQPADRKLALIVLFPSVRGSKLQVFPVSGKITNGRMDMVLPLQFKFASDPEFRLSVSQDGQSYLRVYLSCETKSTDSGETKWPGLSRACLWPLTDNRAPAM